MKNELEEVHLTELESIFMLGIIGCMLFATWEMAQLLISGVFEEWVLQDEDTRKRIILYATSFSMSITAIAVSLKFVFSFRRFGQVINRSFMSYGAVLLIITIAIFIFDYMPKVFSGFAGAAVFTGAIFIVQRKYFTRERIIKSRLEKNKCYSCGENLEKEFMFCPACGVEVGKKCGKCSAHNKLTNVHCVNCGKKFDKEVKVG